MCGRLTISLAASEIKLKIGMTTIDDMLTISGKNWDKDSINILEMQNNVENG
jgi:hypothetical protein